MVPNIRKEPGCVMRAVQKIGDRNRNEAEWKETEGINTKQNYRIKK